MPLSRSRERTCARSYQVGASACALGLITRTAVAAAGGASRLHPLAPPRLLHHFTQCSAAVSQKVTLIPRRVMRTDSLRKDR
jgi:hypothetical protein